MINDNIPNDDLINQVHQSLTECPDDFFSNLDQKHHDICMKINDYLIDKTTLISNEDIQSIINQIDLYHSKTFTPGKSLIPEDKLSVVDNIFSPMDNLPREILAKILADGADFDSILVSKNWYDAMTFKQITDTATKEPTERDQIWKGIADRIGCPPFDAPLGKYGEKVKEYCHNLVELSKELKEVKETPELQDLIANATTVGGMKALNEWRQARDFTTLCEFITILPSFVSSPDKSVAQTLENAKQNRSLFESCKESGYLKSQPITHIDLSNHDLFIIDPCIEELTTLQNINLTGNQITEVPHCFRKLTALTQLYLPNNPITQLTGISHNKNLNDINLSNCTNLERLSPELLELPNLKSMNVLDTKITDIEYKHAFNQPLSKEEMETIDTLNKLRKRGVLIL